MAAELAKGLKTPEDLNQLKARFKKFMIGCFEFLKKVITHAEEICKI